MQLEQFFEPFRRNTIGHDCVIETPYGKKPMYYMDYTASGRLYRPIEEKIMNQLGPLVGNTHSETNITGMTMTTAYHQAKSIIREHVNAKQSDVLLTTGFGMTGAINKLQRMLGLKHEECMANKPVVFITHMEHHSNHISWLETSADVVVVEPNDKTVVDFEDLDNKLIEYKDRSCKIGSFTACSNVSGIQTPYHDLAKIMHRHSGKCFIDFAASAPYVQIDMHPEEEGTHLDAIFFSPHKFLGGPGSSGVLVVDSKLIENAVPDQPGGGTVDWTNPWGGYKYVDDIEDREDGGTPGFLQAIRTAMVIGLKNEMGVINMARREGELMDILFDGLQKIEGLEILASEQKNRLGIISFYVHDTHYNLFVRLLNDRFGIQARGGCSCAGTYGHYLLHIDEKRSSSITGMINQGDLSKKPGWVRVSIHPMMTNAEAAYAVEAIESVVKHYHQWKEDYYYVSAKNHFEHKLCPLETGMSSVFDMS